MRAHRHWKEWGTVLLVLPLTLAVVGVREAEAASEGMRIANVQCPPTRGRNAFYVSNRPPLEPSPFCKLPIGAIAPRGWLRHMLELEAEGMSGHLDEVSLFCRSDGNGWLNTGNPKAYSKWEELPYWLKGFGDLDNTCIYAVCHLKAAADMPARLKVASDDGYVLFVNGKRIAEARDDRRDFVLDMDSINMDLRAGENVVVFKLCNAVGGFGMRLRLTDRKDQPARGITVVLP